MIYAYIRVSTQKQKIDRQLEEINKLNIEKRNIYIDKESGKDFNRTNYQKLMKKLKEKDLLIVKSIDRLGRNYEAIIDEWTNITKVKKANIKILDMPLLDTSNENDLIGKFISDIVLQILSFVSENERNNIKQRQKEGILIAKSKGVRFGRPKIEINDNLNDIFNKYLNKEIKSEDAILNSKLSRNTFYKLFREYKKDKS